MDVVVERVAALDVHKASATACVRVPGERGQREEHVAQFSTTVQGLLALVAKKSGITGFGNDWNAWVRWQWTRDPPVPLPTPVLLICPKVAKPEARVIASWVQEPAGALL